MRGAGRSCVTCGGRMTWFNHVFPFAPDDHDRCHARTCTQRNCPREKVIESGWREKGWPK